MRIFWPVLLAALLVACDTERVYERNFDFEERWWPVQEQPVFEFEVPDNEVPYNLYCNIRNTVSYPYARLFITYYLSDSSGQEIRKELVQAMLFDPKTGEPYGSSAIGDIFDHRIPLLRDYRFGYAGKYKMRFEQFMRTDTLQGVLAVGLRVERSVGK